MQKFIGQAVNCLVVAIKRGAIAGTPYAMVRIGIGGSP